MSSVGTPRVRQAEAPPGAFAAPIVTEAARVSGAGQETDVCYIGYAGRTMLGGFLFCFGLSLAAGFLLWSLGPNLPDSGRATLQPLTLALLGAVWFFQLFRWGYRKLAYYVRVTTHRVFYHRGILQGTPTVLDLGRLHQVEVLRGPWQRFLGVGTISFITEGNPKDSIAVEGILQPLSLAETLRRQMAKAKRGMGSPHEDT